MTARSASYSGTQAVRRALALLRAFSDQAPEQGLADLAAAAGLHKTTAFRLLSALAADGLVMRTADGQRYRLGPEAIALGGRALRANDVRSVARSALVALAASAGETATVELLAGGDVLILDEAHQRESPRAAPSVGTRWPAHATSTGKVLLAGLPDAEVRNHVTAPLSRPARRTIRTMAALRRELARVRAAGYASAVDELEDGFSAIAVPIRSHDGAVVAALSVGGPGARLTAARIAELLPGLRQAAAQISRGLGHP
jgi:DNA-binding IclR family transcriptional regulator